MNARTSITHPLAIAEIRVAPGMGRIGITFCPGKRQPTAMSGAWERDLDLDLDAVAEWGAAAVVTLVEQHELKKLAVDRIGEAVADRHMTWYHLPIQDVTAPGASFEEAWLQHGAALRAIIRDGFDVLVHCKGGLGRAGTVAARLLVELGWDPQTAIDAVRRVRPGAIEAGAQEKHVRAQQPICEPLRDPTRAAVEDRALGCLVGLAIGDAIGTTLEFKSRGSYRRLTDMVGGGPFGLTAGEWTDDTAMALALADSLIAHGTLNERDLMDRFVSWWRRGRYSCTGTCFDIGNATRDALQRYEQSGNPIAGATSLMSAGNGSLMRLAPVVLHSLANDIGLMSELAARQSATTHGAATCIEACQHFAFILYVAIIGKSRSFVMGAKPTDKAGDVARVVGGSWRGAHRSRIHSSGYVAHTLEAALWCVGRTSNFRDAILLAANLGDDADTTAAVTGQLAGAMYGLSGIPGEWLTKLAWAEKIKALGRDLIARTEE